MPTVSAVTSATSSRASHPAVILSWRRAPNDDYVCAHDGAPSGISADTFTGARSAGVNWPVMSASTVSSPRRLLGDRGSVTVDGEPRLRAPASVAPSRAGEGV